jgi:hypothetical protein
LSREALGPSQPPVQRVTEFPSPEVKQPGVKLTTHVYLVPRLRIIGALSQKIIFFHGMHRQNIAMNMTGKILLSLKFRISISVGDM